jgi:hypothetical protein
MAHEPQIPENMVNSNDGHDHPHARAALLASVSPETVAQLAPESDSEGEAPAETVVKRQPQARRAAKNTADETTEASRVAGEANAEMLRDEVQAAQQTVAIGPEAGMRGIEGLAQTVTGVLARATPNPDFVEQSARNMREVTQAYAALARAAQDASRAWLSLTQRSLRTNLEAMAGLARCRTAQDLITLECSLLRDNLQQAIDGAEVIARAQTDAIREASLAFQPRT